MAIIPIIKVHRFWQDENQSSGSCVVLDSNNFPLFAGLSLERGWRNNERNVSCIPIGTYKVVLEWSNKFQTMLWEIKGVPGRSECKFHAANYWFQLNGCNALGLRYKKLNADKYRDLTSSRNTMKAFHQALKPYNRAILIITGETCIN